MREKPTKSQPRHLTEEKLRRLIRTAFEDELSDSPEDTQRMIERAIEIGRAEGLLPPAPPVGAEAENVSKSEEEAATRPKMPRLGLLPLPGRIDPGKTGSG
jgi:hypothetical protein